MSELQRLNTMHMEFNTGQLLSDTHMLGSMPTRVQAFRIYQQDEIVDENVPRYRIALELISLAIETMLVSTERSH